MNKNKPVPEKKPAEREIILNAILRVISDHVPEEDYKDYFVEKTNGNILLMNGCGVNYITFEFDENGDLVWWE